MSCFSNQHLSNQVDNGSDQEEQQSDGNQRGKLQTVSLTKLVGDDTCHCISRSTERIRNLVGISDQHRHRHGLSQCTSDCQDIGRKNTGTCHRENDPPDDLRPCGPIAYAPSFRSEGTILMNSALSEEA